MNKFARCLLAALLLFQLLPPSTTLAAPIGFTPNPQTPYAASFISDCEGQAWFINELERLLNLEQKTLDTITGAADFSNLRAIGLDSQAITGKIPTAIGELNELQYLFLGGNSLSGTIPAGLFTLPKLQNIDLSGNSYSGAIPFGFGTMPALTVLNLKENAYSGSIPASILENQTIEVLNLLGNQLSGTIPPEINQMTGLTYLNLSDNPWGGTIPDLGALTELVALSLWGCALTGELHNSIYTLNNLQILDLAENGLVGEISPDIGNLTDLQYLTLANNKLVGEIPLESGTLTQLQKLNLSDNKLRGTIPDVFTSTTLVWIDLQNNYLRGTVPDTLKARYDDGASVYLQNNYLTGEALKNMEHNSKNFTDGAATEQYQLTATATITISKTTSTNLYTQLRNQSKTSGNSTQKVLLHPDEYVLIYDNTKLAVTVDASGIHAQALTDIPRSESFTLELYILANDGSLYSKVTLTLTTDGNSGGGLGGGGGISSSNPEIATHNPYITGYPDGSFLPESPISRAELAACLSRIAESRGKPITDKELYFTDVPADAWYKTSVEKALQYGLITGYEDGSFRPNSTVTRAEAVTMVNRMLARNPKTAPALQQAESPFHDLQKTHWAYLEILEASVSHGH